ncbi:hypothetical protein OPV22_008395 [Ensete ventricosum]|uniref:Uncharacterized protein n=1 Tax=Ensete ventricosum TaxID=4639 RepID=A0AAV8R2T8_ENSVE|nr:hypothetical protein OPV22_008395 [Ensete ventricosum]
MAASCIAAADPFATDLRTRSICLCPLLLSAVAPPRFSPLRCQSMLGRGLTAVPQRRLLPRLEGLNWLILYWSEIVFLVLRTCSSDRLGNSKNFIEAVASADRCWHTRIESNVGYTFDETSVKKGCANGRNKAMKQNWRVSIDNTRGATTQCRFDQTSLKHASNLPANYKIL